jgi:broad specificity phosphatase PhoE
MINNMHRVDRGRFVKGGIGTVALSFLYSASSHAMGLVKFPCREPLANTYHFIRAGQSMMEEQDIWSTNPLFLTNREAALSPEGVKQVEEASRFLKEQDVVPSIVRYSLAAHTMDTTNILGRELKLGRDRLVPEFNYMDPRAVGKWDMLPLSSTETAVWALDVDEAGAEGQVRTGYQ